jgi:hypothetical protein
MRGTNLEGVLLVPQLDWPGIPATLTAPWHDLEHWRTGGFLCAMKATERFAFSTIFGILCGVGLKPWDLGSPLTHTTLNIHAVIELNLVFVVYYKNNLLVDRKRSSIAGGLFE